jgi:O-Antigen ligase
MTSLRVAGRDLRFGSNATPVLLGSALGAVIGLAVAVVPMPTLAIVLAAGGISSLVMLGPRSARVFLSSLAALCVVYAFAGKGGAYIGVAPVYIGEVVLGLGVVTLALNRQRVRLGLVEVVLLLFMAWEAARTIPFIPLYGIDALRDAVTWGYGAFALVVVTIVTRRDFLRLVLGYRWFVAGFVVLMPVIGIVTKVFDGVIPRWPNTPLGGVPIIFFNHGHTGVHLAGVGAFVLLGLYGLRHRRPPLPEPLVWLGWLATVGIVGSLNRGSMLAASTAGFAAGIVRSARNWVVPAIIGPLVLAALLLLNPVIDVGAVRKVSFEQLLANVGSVFGSSSDPDLASTAAWRLAWWNKIIGYTVDGPYFWDGKGYGVNLADADGFQVNWDGSLRAPHNGHLEILARSGVPGLALWILLQAAYAITLLRGMFYAARHKRRVWLRVEGWLFIYWVAAMINLSFDPYLEGPHGGIWFWSLMGLGLAATRAARIRAGDRRRAGPEPVTEPLRGDVRTAAAGAGVGG